MLDNIEGISKHSKYYITSTKIPISHDLLAILGEWVKCYPLISISGSEMAKPALAPREVATAIKRLGQNIRVARIRRRMSQEELAQASNITRKTLYELETGNPGATIGTLFTVVWKLGLMSTTTALVDPDTDEHGKILEQRSAKRARRPAATDTNS